MSKLDELLARKLECTHAINRYTSMMRLDIKGYLTINAYPIRDDDLSYDISQCIMKRQSILFEELDLLNRKLDAINELLGS
jgi:hypothetical protein